MLEPCVNQAAGLQSLAPASGPRLVAVASHGQQQGELPLLWALCNSWIDMGLSVLVLDGHAQEAARNAGLAQLLDNPLERCQGISESVAWSVLPAAQGFARLCTQALPTATLGELFQNYSVVLVYTGAATMTRLFKHSALEPLLVLPPLKSSSLTAYQALKQLFMEAQLRPTVANIALSSVASPSMPNSAPSNHLQQCAMAFLGYQVRPITVSAGAPSTDNAHDGVNRLALQLLENAVVLERHPSERMH